MPTTTNYGWTTPADTDLVKDGASAIRTLGTSIDTTTKNLNPSTTLGDIEYRSSSANTNTRLGIGSTGQVLTVSDGVPAWQTISAGGMTLLSTTTLSGSSTTISSISTAYNNLSVLISGVNVSSNAYIELQANSTGGIYTYPAIGSNPTNNNAVTQESFTTSTFYIFQNQLKASNTDNVYQINFINYASSSYYKPFFAFGNSMNQENNRVSSLRVGGVQSNTAITSLRISCDAGTFSAGQVLIYGVK